MKKQRVYFIAIIVVIVIAITIFVAYYYNANSHLQNGVPSTGSFFLEPVVDLAIPHLYNNGVNAPLNLTSGETASLVVEVFPLINLNASVGATISSLSNPNENLSGIVSSSFNPSHLSIADGSSANTTLSINLSESAKAGQYTVTVTATNLENESQYWGTIFQMNVLG